MTDLEKLRSAARLLARRTMEYVHQPAGGDLDDILECDVKMRELALSVFEVLGEDPPTKAELERAIGG